MEALVSILSANIAKLPEQKQVFAKSLCDQFSKKGGLSEKQNWWVGKLVEMASGVEDAKPAAVRVGSMQSVIDLFAKAAKKLKYPQIDVRLENGNDYRLHIAGSASKYKGSVVICYIPPAWELTSKVWLGTVSREGNWTPSKHCTEVMSADVMGFLQEFSADAPAAAAKYGKLYGHCIFCKKKLDDPKSLAAGYGATCAKNWGMPYGSKLICN